jgi:hypothetical protein
MKKIFTLCFFILFYAVCQSKPVDDKTAAIAAGTFLKYSAKSMLLNSASAQQIQLVYKPLYRASGAKTAAPLFYIFNCKAVHGFVIISADDNAIPVLGYSDESNFDTSHIPPQVVKWIEGYKNQLRYMAENKAIASSDVSQSWKDLASGNRPAVKTPTLNTVVVAPLLQTTWDQSPYYNALCPYDNQAADRTVTGCVATATAQVMKFWNYPATGSGFHSYNTEKYGTLSANFGSTTYQWAAMPNSVSSANNAVATLMYQVGVSVDMNYGVASTGGSGAYVVSSLSPVTNCAEYALKTYFGYDNNLKGVGRSNYTDAQWRTLLQGELSAGRPVIYAGFGGGGGHCFVADGYDDNNMFHFNWGWSGYYNGYFAVDALNPGGVGTGGGTGGFNSGQQAITGIKPPGGGGGGGTTPGIRLYDYVTPSSASIDYGQAFTVSTNIENAGTVNFSGDYCAAIFDASNTFIDYVDTLPNYTLQGGYYHYVNKLVFSSAGLFSLLPGTYKIGIFYRPAGGNWVQVANNGAYVNLVPLTVVHANSIELYSAIGINPVTNFVQGQAASVNFNIINKGTTTFTGYYAASLYNLDGSFVQTIGTINESGGLPAGYTYSAPYITLSTAAVTANPGTYLMAIQHYPAGGNAWQLTGSTYFTNPVKVTVKSAALQPDQYEPNNTVTQAYNLPVSFVNNAAVVKTTGSNCHVGSDYDYYKVVLPAGYDYSISARLQDSYSSSNGLVYTLDGLFSDSTSEAGSTWSDAYDDVMPNNIIVHGGGTVYFFVSPYFTGETGSYLLDMNITRTQAVISTYTFTGSGNWNVAANWANNNMPPNPLPAGKEIIVQPAGTGECILNVPQTISAGATLTVPAGKKLRVLGNLTVK